VRPPAVPGPPFAGAHAAPVATEPEADPWDTPAAPAYTVNLTSNTTGKGWTGHESVTFTNAYLSSPIALHEVTPVAESGRLGHTGLFPIKEFSEARFRCVHPPGHRQRKDILRSGRR